MNTAILLMVSVSLIIELLLLVLVGVILYTLFAKDPLDRSVEPLKKSREFDAISTDDNIPKGKEHEQEPRFPHRRLLG